MARERSTRLNVTLDAQYAEKLSRLAERTHAQEGTLARSLLSHALDEADPDPRHVADLLDGIPGAYERALLGMGEQVQRGVRDHPLCRLDPAEEHELAEEALSAEAEWPEF